MNILVAVGSKYGSTTGIAGAIGAVLRERGHHVTVAAFGDAPDPVEFDAFVLGGAIYMGHWLKPGIEFVERHAAALSARPVWLFSSGPLGDPPIPPAETINASALIEATGAREHRVFAGALDRKQLHFGDKAIAMALRAPEGDFRDWSAISAWASGITDALAGAETEHT